MFRIVPWMCREEWLTTYQNLYNFQDPKSQVKGVQRVQVWKSRSSGKIPLSIEVTAGLITATTLDAEQSQGSSLTVRLAMAMAIVRFVNGMVDNEQKGVYARSVQSIADDIGIPDWLVDLRHEATHAGLPSLEVLQAGCRFSLDWLRTHYWESVIAEIEQREEKLVKLVQSFIEEYGVHLIKGEKKKKRKRKSQGIIKEIVDLTCEYNMWDVVLDLLVGKLGLLFPSSETLKCFAAYWPDTMEPSAEAISLDLPKEALSMWGPLLKAWNKGNDKFLSKLVRVLVIKICELENNSENAVLIRYISCWVHFILLNVNNEEEEKKTWKITIDYVAILEVCLRACSSYSQIFIPLIFENLKTLPDTVKEKIEKLIQLSFGTANSTTCSEDIGVSSAMKKASVYDGLAKSFPCLGDRVKSRLEKPSEVRNTGWQQCNASFARSIPLGALVGCKPMQFELLELPEEVDLMEVETSDSSLQGSSYETSREHCEISGYCDLEDAGLSGLQCETIKGLSESTIESIGKQIWIF